jgi:hypothetical protein
VLQTVDFFVLSCTETYLRATLYSNVFQGTVPPDPFKKGKRTGEGKQVMSGRGGKGKAGSGGEGEKERKGKG